MKRDDPLFAPLRINGLEVAGRVFKTFTTETLATEDGFTGNMYAGRSGKPTYRSPGIDADDKLPGLQRLTEMVHRQRCDYCNQCVARGGREGLTCVNPQLHEHRAAMLRAAGF